MENLTEVVLRDWNHLKGLISVCEGAVLILWCLTLFVAGACS